MWVILHREEQVSGTDTATVIVVSIDALESFESNSPWSIIILTVIHLALGLLVDAFVQRDLQLVYIYIYILQL